MTKEETNTLKQLLKIQKYFEYLSNLEYEELISKTLYIDTKIKELKEISKKFSNLSLNEKRKYLNFITLLISNFSKFKLITNKIYNKETR